MRYNTFHKNLGKFLFLFFLVIVPLNLSASSGNGISYRVNNFKLKITWPWLDQYDFVDNFSFIDLTFIINENYALLEKSNRNIWLDCSLDANNKFLITCYELKNEYVEVKKLTFTGKSDFSETINNFVISHLILKKDNSKKCTLYIAFLPSDYLQNDDNRKINNFLQKSELYLVHDAAIQSNMQGYVYSIFFKKESMYKFLAALDANRIIINIRNIDDLNDKWFYNIDLTLFD